MNIDIIFGDFIVSDFLGLDVKTTENLCYDLKNKDKGIFVSNKDGWHSKAMKYTDDLMLPFRNVADLSCDKANTLKDKLGFSDKVRLELKEFWINISPKGAWMETHTHGDCFITCVYYVKVPEKAGNITFIKESKKYSKEYITGQSLYTEHFHEERPVADKILMFPPWLSHKVEKNEDDDDRISIAMNFKIVR